MHLTQSLSFDRYAFLQLLPYWRHVYSMWQMTARCSSNAQCLYASSQSVLWDSKTLAASLQIMHILAALTNLHW